MRALAWLAALLLLAPPLAAQAVRGTLVSTPGGDPVPGALVTLLDADGGTVDGRLSDAGGRFELRAQVPGEYRVRAERVGYATADPVWVFLNPGETRELRLEAAPAASVLDELVVAAPDRECVVDPREGARTVALWEEARKSLELAELSRTLENRRFTVRAFQRQLEPGSMVVRRQRSDTATAWTPVPYVSLPAADLAEKGYVRTDGGGHVFYSPDATVLLSDAFLDSHCFRVQPGSGSQAGLVGLAFEPTGGRRLPDVQGVLWLDPSSAELRSLEFTYTGLRGDLSVPGEWGGRVEFERLPDGAVIVRRWSLRMPMVGRVPAPGGSNLVQPRAVLAAVREEGAEVVSIALASGAVAGASTAAAVRGTVIDSARGVPLAGATVFLAGTEHEATTDSAGGFTLAGVPEGRYAVAFAHPRLDSLASVPEPVEVAVGAAGEVAVALGIPRGAAPRVAAAPVPRAAPTDTAAVRLEGITVTAEAAARVLSVRGFFERKQMGVGTFLTAQDIAARNRARVVDVVTGIRGMAATPVGERGRAFANRRHGVTCRAPVYLDGILVPGNMLDRLLPEQIAGIEVYDGPQTPPRFVPCQTCGPVCGAVVVWTKRGET